MELVFELMTSHLLGIDSTVWARPWTPNHKFLGNVKWLVQPDLSIIGRYPDTFETPLYSYFLRYLYIIYNYKWTIHSLCSIIYIYTW
jgi:hypothetical protein